MDIKDLCGNVLLELGVDTLRGVNLSGASLEYADLVGAELTGADLSGADLRDSDLRGANLTDANLRGAYLSASQFSGTIVVRACFVGTDIRWTGLHKELLIRNLASFDDTTLFANVTPGPHVPGTVGSDGYKW